MAETKRKGDLAEAMVMAESLRRGLRLLPARTNQSKNVLWAKDFTDW
jgi:hypothetical protein